MDKTEKPAVKSMNKLVKSMNKRQLTGAVLYIASPEEEVDIVYRTGFSAPDPIVFLEEGFGRKHMVVSDLEFKRAQRVATRCRVWNVDLLGLKAPASRRLTDRALALLGKLDLRNVRVTASFPVACADFLRKHNIKVEVINERVFKQREVKQPGELDKIRQSQSAANKAMFHVWSLLKQSGVDRKGVLVLKGKKLTSEFMRAEINKTLLEHDCSGFGTIAACGAQAADPHEVGTGPLYAGQGIVVDIFPKHQVHGYWGDMTRTFVKGRASPEFRKMYYAVKAASEKALSLLKSGIAVSTIHNACVGEFEKRGYKTGDGEGFIHSTGHGVGLNVHEAPSIGPSSKRLRVGNVITIEPGLYYHAVGGARIENLVVITKNGFEYVAGFKNCFEVR